MATRGTVTIKSNHVRTDLYRHWDGYPAATGVHIGHILRALPSYTQDATVVALLTSTEDQPHGSGVYNLTSCADEHTDRDWHYEITLHPKQEPEIRVFERAVFKMRPVFEGGLFQFRKWVSGHLRDMHLEILRRNAA